MIRRLLTLAFLTLALLLTACNPQSSAINEIGLIYGGGTFEEKEYKGVFQPGRTNELIGLGDDVYLYRIDQRSWIGRDGKGVQTDRPPVEFVTRDGVRMRAPFEMYFTLNQEEGVLRSFHENIGVKTDAWTAKGWVSMLQTYVDPPLERAADAAGLSHDMRPLYATDEARRKFQGQVTATFKRNLTEIIGGNYFCGPSYQKPGDPCGEVTFTVGKPEPVNAEIVQAIEAEQKAVADELAQRRENLRIATELRARRDEVALYGPFVYAYLQAIEAARAAKQPPPPMFPPGTQPLPTVAAR